MVGVLTLHIHLSACTSLKEKRGRLKPLLHRLQREFNVSVAEMGRQDSWQEAVVACAMVGNDAAFLQSALENVKRWIRQNWPDGEVMDDGMELM